MTQDAILILECLFNVIWKFFNSWYIPGTHVTPAGWFLFLALTGIVLRFIQHVMQTYSHKEDNSYSKDNKD